jgi:hypothetical protein
MKSASILALAAALGLAAPAAALAACEKPAPPVVVDGATASMDQLRANQGEVQKFMSDSDAFQACVVDDLAAQKKAATETKTKVDPAVAKAAEAQLNANQADKEKVGGAFNAAVHAFKAAHPS